MASVVDELVVSFGLDPSNFTKGQKRVLSDLQKVQNESNRAAKAMAADGDRLASFFSKAKIEALGLLGVTTGLTGLKALVKGTSESLADLGRAATNIGIDPTKLKILDNALRANGASAGAAAASLEGIAKNQNEWNNWHDNPQFFAALQSIGVTDANMAPEKILEEFQKYIEREIKLPNGAQEIHKLGGMLGYDDTAVNAQIQIKTYENLKKEMQEAARYVPTKEQIQAATSLQHAFVELGEASEQWGVIMASKLDPYLEPVLVWMKEFIINQPDAVLAILGLAAAFGILGGVSILKTIKNFLSGKAISDAAKQAVKTARSAAAEELGVAAEAGAAEAGGAGVLGFLGPIGAFIAGLWPGKANPDSEYGTNTVGNPRLDASDERKAQIRDWIMQETGLDKNVASGFVSNFNAESGIQGINELHPVVPGSRGGFGWSQWTNDRRVDLENYAKQHNLPVASDEANMGFFLQELKTKFKSVYDQLKNGGLTAEQAASIVFDKYVIAPSGKLNHISEADRISKLPSVPRAVPHASNNNSQSIVVGSISVNAPHATNAKQISNEIRIALANSLTMQANRGLA